MAFDFDDFGTQTGEVHTGIRDGPDPAEVQNSNPFQG
jgi:hypothetical protein